MTDTPVALPRPFGFQLDPDDRTDRWPPSSTSRAHWAFLADDGSRRVIDFEAPFQEPAIVRDRPSERPFLARGEGAAEHPPGSIRYLDYDWSISVEPVNQKPWLDVFREHLAIFADDLDVGMGSREITRLTETERLAVFEALSILIGSAWRLYQAWGAIDPQQEFADTSALAGQLVWKAQLAHVQLIDERLCGLCQIASYPRQFGRNADLPLFHRQYQAGAVYAPDTSASPWSLGDLIDHANTVVGQSQDEIDRRLAEFH